MTGVVVGPRSESGMTGVWSGMQVGIVMNGLDSSTSLGMTFGEGRG